MQTLALIIFVVTVLGGIFFYFIKKNNEDRKENLNIIKVDNKLKFYLSDDIFFTTDINENMKLKHTLIRTIKDEISCLTTTVRKISLINFGDEVLENRLNRMLEKAQKKSL